MRSLLAGCALLMLGSVAAEAQPYWGFGGPPRPPGWGWSHPHPYGWGWRHPHPYGWGYGAPRRCRWVDGYYGPRRICRGW